MIFAFDDMPYMDPIIFPHSMDVNTKIQGIIDSNDNISLYIGGWSKDLSVQFGIQLDN